MDRLFSGGEASFVSRAAVDPSLEAAAKAPVFDAPGNKWNASLVMRTAS